MLRSTRWSLLRLWLLAIAAGSALAAIAAPARRQWVRLSARLVKSPTSLVAMLVAVAAFGWASRLSARDTTAFASGADLALPPSPLAGVIGRHQRMEATGGYYRAVDAGDQAQPGSRRWHCTAAARSARLASGRV